MPPAPEMEIARILLDSWDPLDVRDIDMQPEAEYIHEAEAVLQILKAGKSENDVVLYLKQAAEELGYATERDRTCGNAIWNWWVDSSGVDSPEDVREDMSEHPTAFYGKFSLDSARAIRQLDAILQNVFEHLSTAEGASIDLTLEINAKAEGYDERVRRVVTENAAQLGIGSQEFE